MATAILDIEFEWPVVAAGYALRDRKAENKLLRARSRSGPNFTLVEIVPCGTEVRRKRPLALNGELYLRFAELEDRPQSFAEFAGVWGLLTSRGADAEPTSFWSRHVRLLKAAVDCFNDDPRKLARFEPEGEGTQMQPQIVARLIDAGQPRPLLRFTPRDLLHALWLQLFAAAALGKEVKSCDRCGRLFERGAGTERGRKARFCSDACRFGFHNERRSKGGSP